MFLRVVIYPWKLYLNHVIFVEFSQACSGIPNILQNNKGPICQGWVELFVYLLHVITHPWKLQFFHLLIVAYGLACPKLTNH